MQAVRQIHLVASAADMFSHLKLAVNNELRAEARAGETVRARGATDAVLAAGVDEFFGEQMAAMIGDGHWANVVKFNENGNHMAGIQFVPTAGELPEPIFGPLDWSNACTLQVRAMRDDTILMQVLTRQNTPVSARVPMYAFTREHLASWFADFVRYSVRFAADQHAAEARRH